MQISARTVKCSLHNVEFKVLFRSLIMASAAKRPRRVTYTPEEVLELLENDESGNEGMSSDEESVLDHLLLDSEEDLR